MASRHTTPLEDMMGVTVMPSPAESPGASMQWLAAAYPVEAMLMPRREYRPFGLDHDEPGPEDLV